MNLLAYNVVFWESQVSGLLVFFLSEISFSQRIALLWLNLDMSGTRQRVKMLKEAGMYETIHRNVDCVELESFTVSFDRIKEVPPTTPLNSLCSWKDCPTSQPLTEIGVRTSHTLGKTFFPALTSSTAAMTIHSSHSAFTLFSHQGGKFHHCKREYQD